MHGLFAEVEVSGDIGVGQAAHSQPQHVDLSIGQRDTIALVSQ